MQSTLNLLAGASSTGTPAYENVRVEPVRDGRYRLLASPGLALGLAAGDVFEVREDGTYTVVERGGNVCIQIFRRAGARAVEADATSFFSEIGGRLDGEDEKLLVYTVNVAVGFPAIETVLGKIVAKYGDAEWYYGNVYDPIDGVTPLNWWLQ